MQTIIKLVLIVSILINIVALWGLFHYIKYGGSPLGELKRIITGQTHQPAKKLSFDEQNAQLLKIDERSGKDELRVVFFGASITNRWNLDRDFPKVHMVNRGVGGQLVDRMTARFKRDVLDLNPRAVIIKFCSINIRPEMPLKVLEDNMAMMSQLAIVNGIVPIISTIIPAAKAEAHIGNFQVADSLNKFNDWVRNFAKEKNYPLIDFAKAIGDEESFLPRDCSVDPVHVNDKGYEILTEAARPVVYEVVGVKSVNTK